MKLRICGNSVRVRLSRSEVSCLGEGQKIEQVTEFSSSARLITSVESSTAADAVTARFSAGTIRLVIPAARVNAWAGSELVSIEALQAIDSGRSLSILVEKDFECLHSAAEENADAFPNPRG